MASAAMRQVFEIVAKIAPTGAPVLIQGEPGTGKESIAGEIHRQSQRAAGPLVRVPCGAMSDPELDAQLFGGQATPQTSRESVAGGLLGSAAGGTLFLHNVADLPFWAMVKLLDAFRQPAAEPHRPSNPGGL